MQDTSGYVLYRNPPQICIGNPPAPQVLLVLALSWRRMRTDKASSASTCMAVAHPDILLLMLLWHARSVHHPDADAHLRPTEGHPRPRPTLPPAHEGGARVSECTYSPPYAPPLPPLCPPYATPYPRSCPRYMLCLGRARLRGGNGLCVIGVASATPPSMVIVDPVLRGPESLRVVMNSNSRKAPRRI